MMMTGVVGSFNLSCCMNSRPVAPGMRMSLITACGELSSSASSASCAAENDRKIMPSRESDFSITQRMLLSSSMIQTGRMYYFQECWDVSGVG